MKQKEGPGCRVFVEEVPFTRVHSPIAAVASAPSQQAPRTKNAFMYGEARAFAAGQLLAQCDLGALCPGSIPHGDADGHVTGP